MNNEEYRISKREYVRQQLQILVELIDAKDKDRVQMHVNFNRYNRGFRYKIPRYDDWGELYNLSLYIAADEGFLDICTKLIERKACVNSRNRSENAPLHIAAAHNHVSVVKLLLDHNARIDEPNYCFESPFHNASYNKSFDAAQFLVSRGANVNTRTVYDQTPLHASSERDCVEIIKLLVDHGANIDARCDTGNTPLHIAAIYQRTRAVKLLLWLGADATLKSKEHEHGQGDGIMPSLTARECASEETLVNYLKCALDFKSILCLGLLVDKEETLFTQFLVRGPIYDPRLLLIVFGFCTETNNNKRK